METRLGVSAIIINEKSEILILLSPDRGWEPPGGYVELGESIMDALHREVAEETGYEISVMQFIGIYKCVRENEIVTLSFLCKPIREISLPGDEALDVRWICMNEIDSYVKYQPHLMRISDSCDAMLSPGKTLIVEYQPKPFKVFSRWSKS